MPATAINNQVACHHRRRSRSVTVVLCGTNDHHRHLSPSDAPMPSSLDGMTPHQCHPASTSSLSCPPSTFVRWDVRIAINDIDIYIPPVVAINTVPVICRPLLQQHRLHLEHDIVDVPIFMPSPFDAAPTPAVRHRSSSRVCLKDVPLPRSQSTRSRFSSERCRKMMNKPAEAFLSISSVMSRQTH